MAKSRTHYLCRDCGSVHSRWMGRCPDCGAWDGLERYVEPAAEGASEHASMASAWAEAEGPGAGTAQGQPIAARTSPGRSAAAMAIPLPEVETADVSRMPTGIGEMDRVLGGGFVPGSVVLLGGDPGIGKSTLLLEAAGRMARSGRRILYVSSEESAYQTRLRAERVLAAEGTEPEGSPDDHQVGLSGLEQLYILAETSLGRIVEQARTTRPDLLVLDSIQMIYKADLEASPGSVTQLRRCCTELVYLAKLSGMAIVVVGHVTKDGQLAGPKLLEHLVDAVLSFEGDRHHAHRVVRGIKNRYGTTLEVGLFEMTGAGLAEVTDVGAIADPHADPPPGSALCPVLHGSRCLLVELQALTAPGFLGSAKRKTSGLDASRLAMLIAVLEQHGGLRLADQDVFVSAVGGLKVVEPAADLALCLAIAGAHFRTRLPRGVAVIGEVGLGGEVRHVRQVEQRAKEAARRGYRRVVMPAAPGTPGRTGMDVVAVSTVADALGLLARIMHEADRPAGDPST